MPDDQTIATILAICDLLGQTATDVEAAIVAYERALNRVIRYRRSTGQTELGGIPQEVAIKKA